MRLMLHWFTVSVVVECDKIYTSLYMFIACPATMNSSKISMRRSRSNFASKSTNTSDDLFLCRQCHIQRVLETGENNGKSIIDEYIHSLQYINVCHTMINELLKSRNPTCANINMPDVPNFLHILTCLAKNVEGLTELQDMATLQSAIQSLDKKDEKPISEEIADRHSNDKLKVNTEVKSATDQLTQSGTSNSNDRITGIPRRIKKPNSNTKPVQSATTASARHEICLEKSKTEYVIQLNKRRSESNIDDVQELSDVDTPTRSNSDVDSFEKPMTKVSDTVNSLESAATSKTSCHRPKIRNVKSKTKRDLLMIQNYLKRWGIDMPPLEKMTAAKVEENFNTDSNCEFHELCSSQNSEKEEEIFMGQDESDLDPVQNLLTKPNLQQSTVFVSNIGPAENAPSELGPPQQINSFSDLAASAMTLENTFITHEKPVWHSISSPFGPSDESDIEPDEDITIPQEPVPQPKPIPMISINQPQPRLKKKYKVVQKPQDDFLAPTRRRSVTNIDSEYILAVSDLGEFIDPKSKKGRNKQSSNFILPEQIIANIGILTKTGEIKPEQEPMLKELRNRLSTDIHTTVFRKPRNRKMESNDIVHLRSDSRFTDTAP